MCAGMTWTSWQNVKNWNIWLRLEMLLGHCVMLTLKSGLWVGLISCDALCFPLVRISWYPFLCEALQYMVLGTGV